MFKRFICREADEGTGEGGVETPIESPAEAAPEAPVEQASAQPAAPEFDYRSAYEEARQKTAAYEQALRQQYQQQQEFQQRFQQAFFPQQQKPPQYVTADSLREFQQNLSREFEAKQTIRQYQSEMSAAKEKFADLFSEIPDAEELIAARWQSPAAEKAGKSVLQIAKEMDDMLAKSFEKRQAKYVSGKEKVAVATKGSPRAGGAPPPSSAGKARGFARFRAALSSVESD